MMFLTKVSLKKKMMVGGIVPMVLIIGLGMMSFQSINALLSIHEKVDETNEIIGDIDAIKKKISALEIREKNFLITGNEMYLDSSTELKQALALSLSGLKERTKEKWADHLTAIDVLIGDWYRETDKEILARKKIDMTSQERKTLRQEAGETLSLKVEDIIDPKILREFQKHYDGATGVSNLVVEKDGTPVKFQGYDEFQEFCFGYQRKNKKGLEMCMKSDIEGPRNAEKKGKSWYFCYSGGLIDFGFPVMVDGEQIGNWLGGQILLEKPDEEKFRKQAADIEIEDVDGYIDALNKVPIVPEEKLEAAIELLKVTASTFSRMGNDLYLRNRLIEIVDAGTAENLIVNIRSALDEITKTELKLLNASQISSEKAAGTVSKIILGGTAAAFLFSLMITFFITRNILHQLGGEPSEIEQIARRIAEGDLTMDFESDGSDETGLFAAMKIMVEKLRDILADVKSASSSTAVNSQEMNVRSEEMAQGASEQAASAEQISSSMEQMSATIRQNADNAAVTEKIALRSAETATKGRNATAETVAAMKRIAEKVLFIQDIARQINMLALNAAIEAARAGEHGKGFAVVASEVGSLSKQTQKSAKEIIELTASSVDIAENAGEMLTRIVPDIQKTAELVQEINSASNEQNTGAEQINEAMQQLDEIIQQNTAVSEGIAATSEELSKQAQKLRSVTEFFKIKEVSQKSKADIEERLKEISPRELEIIQTILAKPTEMAEFKSDETEPGDDRFNKKDGLDSEFEVY